MSVRAFSRVGTLFSVNSISSLCTHARQTRAAANKTSQEVSTLSARLSALFSSTDSQDSNVSSTRKSTRTTPSVRQNVPLTSRTEFSHFVIAISHFDKSIALISFCSRRVETDDPATNKATAMRTEVSGSVLVCASSLSKLAANRAFRNVVRSNGATSSGNDHGARVRVAAGGAVSGRLLRVVASSTATDSVLVLVVRVTGSVPTKSTYSRRIWGWRVSARVSFVAGNGDARYSRYGRVVGTLVGRATSSSESEEDVLESSENPSQSSSDLCLRLNTSATFRPASTRRRRPLPYASPASFPKLNPLTPAVRS
mmetsp:Transcript_12971/g.48509  ORF Transcript_12971/g.48509 Transcript_12971/m.48509 type:complete len:312 (+) Transcript_12971:2795-3730(+)